MPADVVADGVTPPRHDGRCITFYLPGMFLLDRERGLYPAVSVTGSTCAFSCDHCNRVILKTMVPATTPESLLETARRIRRNGGLGMLVSGGCDPDGHLPWERFAPVVRRIKEETGLLVSAHAGFPDRNQARLLRDAGVDQVLIDVIGDDDTLRKVYHAPFDTAHLRDSLLGLRDAGLSVIPHVVCGLHFGRMVGEMRALSMIAEIDPELLVIVSLMPLPGTPMRDVVPPAAEAVAAVLREAKRLMPGVPRSLGCARARGSRRLERLALEAGVERMALPSPGTVEYAGQLGYAVKFQKTCCSVKVDLSAESWAGAERISLNHDQGECHE